jgi:hypothetical protein
MDIFLTGRRGTSCSVAAPSSLSFCSLPAARLQGPIHSIPFGGRMVFRRYTAAAACRQPHSVMPKTWQHVSQWTTQDSPSERQAARALRMWPGDARRKAAQCKCGKIHRDTAQTCCWPTSKPTAWHLPAAARAVIGACSSVGSAARRDRLQNRRKSVRCGAQASLTETTRFKRSRFYELKMS